MATTRIRSDHAARGRASCAPPRAWPRAPTSSCRRAAWCAARRSARTTCCARLLAEVHFIRPPLCDVLGMPLPFDTGERMVSARRPGQAAGLRPGPRRGPLLRRRCARWCISSSMPTGTMRRALFGRWLAEAGRELLAGIDVIVPVPLTRWRLLSRRFNQAAILAQELVAANRRGRWTRMLLRRTRFTKTPGRPDPRPAAPQRGGRLQRAPQPKSLRSRAATCCSSTT